MRNWTEVLPDQWRGNPGVILVTAPRDAKSKVMVLKSGEMLGVLQQEAPHVGRVLHGLQVIYPELATYPAHQDFFDKVHIPMLPPRYIGPLLELPQNLLTTDLVPLLFLRDAMYTPYLDVISYMKKLLPDHEKNAS